MFKQLGRFGVLAVCLFVIAMVGCGPDDPPVEEDPIKFVSADPAEGSTIQNDATITVTFDGTPEGLKVTGGTAIPGGKTVSIAGPFAAGPLVLGLQWEGDGVVLSYTVAEPPPPPAAIIDVDPPEGRTIDAYEEIWVTFDSPPARVWVTPGNAYVEDNIVYIDGPFDSGLLELTIGWDDEEHTLHYTVLQDLVPPEVIAVNPSSGSVIAWEDTIVVTFDKPPVSIGVSAGVADVDGNLVYIDGPFNPGLLVLRIVWDGGSETFFYTVIGPDVTAPTVTGGTLADGDLDVSFVWLNADEVIEIEFSEEVEGDIFLVTEDGDDVGWIGEVEGDIGRLLLVKGKELRPETTYVIAGTVSDVAGNILDFSITFVTKGIE